MKTLGRVGMVAMAALGIYLLLPAQEAAAQPGAGQAAGTPPIGRVVEVTLVAWPVGTGTPMKITGNLLSMTGDWIVVKEGSFENWMPKEKVLNMKASR
jgi:hypothetical protein